MKKTFIVNDVSYVIEVVDSSITLYIDLIKSPTVSYVVDPLDPFDEAPDRLLRDHKTKDIFKIVREVRKFFDEYIKKENPYYFVFSANERRKEPLYKKFSERLAKEYGYDLFTGNGLYSFYRSS